MATATADPVQDAIAQVLAGDRPVRVRPDCPITDQYLAHLADRHEGIWLETLEGELIISGSTDERTSAVEGDLYGQVWIWALLRGLGFSRPMTGGFRPPGWEFKVPDISWISDERQAAARRQPAPRRYQPIAPEFIIEVRSPSESLNEQRDKVVGWTSHGVLLGLLVDPPNRNVHIYRDGRELQVLHRPEHVSCEPEMPGLTLDFARIWRIMDA